MTPLPGAGQAAWSGPVELLLPLVGGAFLGFRLALAAAVVVGLLAAAAARHRRPAARSGLPSAVGAATIAAALTLLVARAVSVTQPAAAAVRGLPAVAAVTLVTVVLWRAAAGRAGRWALPALVVAVVGRDGIEAALVLAGYADGGVRPWAGVVAGLLAAAALGAGIRFVASRLTMSLLRRTTGVVLVAVSAGMLADGIGALQQGGWLPSGAALDTGGWADWWTAPGALLRVVLHLTPAPTALQFAVWLGYLVAVPVVLWAAKPAPPPTPHASAPR